jgi:hypothetical protein
MALIPYLILAFVPRHPKFAKVRKKIWVELGKPEYKKAAKFELEEFWKIVNENARDYLKKQGVKFPSDVE